MSQLLIDNTSKYCLFNETWTRYNESIWVPNVGDLMYYNEKTIFYVNKL